jgi:hypothetical protein
MTIDEILQRIVKAHLRTIALCMLIPMAVVGLVEIRTPTTYDAQVRIQTVSSAPASSTEAEGLSSRVLALATTPQLVQTALKLAGEPATAAHSVDVATHRVSAERLGESSVVVLSVLDTDPAVASRTASALADKVVTFMNDGNRRPFNDTLTHVDAQYRAATASRDRLQRDLALTNGLMARKVAEAELANAQQTVNQLADERSSLMLADVNRDHVVALDPTQPTVQPVPSALIPRLALAMLLGLLAGLTIAVVQETLRPRLAGIRVLARLLDVPILGSTGQASASLAGALTLAARRQGVETVVLLGVEDRDEKVARGLLEALPSGWQRETVPTSELEAAQRTGGNGSGGTDARFHGPGATLSTHVRFTDRFGVAPSEELTAGVVVVSSGNSRRSSLDHVQDMVRATRWPVVGVVEVSIRRRWRVAA